LHAHYIAYPQDAKLALSGARPKMRGGRGNPLSRSDGNTSLAEPIACDVLNRLTSAVVNSMPPPVSRGI
jgi:hypothetical protein